MKKKYKLLAGGILLILILASSYFLGFYSGKKSFKETGLIINENNISYSKHFDNYYGFNYGNDEKGVFFEIVNPCLTFEKVIGESMQPYYNDEAIIIVDTCFSPKNLEVGDVILFYFDWNQTSKLHHRIIDIDYQKELILTQGDNLDNFDEFITFNQIYGKEIGVLNILEDKKVVKELYTEPQEQICVCSSNNILKVCYTDRKILMNDNFVKENNLKEENCII